MIKYIIIDTGVQCILRKVYCFEIPFYWVYCKIKRYEIKIYERSDLN